MNKLIFSRKGFDSKYGGIPSTWAEDGELVSFPIPSDAASDETRYDGIVAGGMTLEERFRGLPPRRSLADHCHHDPDLVKGARPRGPGGPWRATLGQADAAEGHLARSADTGGEFGRRVGKGDVFLFFGWFRRAAPGPAGVLSYVPGAPDLHVLFGYLQVGQVVALGRESRDVPGWLADHPHASKKRREKKHNTVYAAADRLVIRGDTGLPGAGVFRFDESLVLTAVERDGTGRFMSRSRWNLPESVFGRRPTTYHPKPWREGYFQSAAIGQEFVVDADELVRGWALERIMAGAARP